VPVALHVAADDGTVEDVPRPQQNASSRPPLIGIIIPNQRVSTQAGPKGDISSAAILLGPDDLVSRT
jgi:hypothetical protein